MSGTGTGTATTELSPAVSTLIVIRDHQPGEVVRIVFLTVAQAQQLPAIPADALQIAIAPSGGI